MCYCPTTNPTPKLSPHRRLWCIFRFSKKHHLVWFFKPFELRGHRQCPHKPPSNCNTSVIPMLLYNICVLINHINPQHNTQHNTHTHTHTHTPHTTHTQSPWMTTHSLSPGRGGSSICKTHLDLVVFVFCGLSESWDAARPDWVSRGFPFCILTQKPVALVSCMLMETYIRNQDVALGEGYHVNSGSVSLSDTGHIMMSHKEKVMW